MPYWRLSGFYFFFFAIVGALVPYWGPYLQGLGFSAGQVGESIALINLMRVVAPNLLGYLSDRWEQRLRVVRVAALLALLALAGLQGSQDFGWLLLMTGLFSFFWNGALPQFEAATRSTATAASVSGARSVSSLRWRSWAR